MTQKNALDLLKLGHNVYLTGAAGSGKTHLLNTYIKYLKSNGIGVGVTASTGIAATHMNGKTIHSFSGIGIKDQITDTEIEALLWKPHLQSTFAKTNVLVIDEVSMLHSFRLDMVNRICQAFKNNQLAFGGMQVILCGDLFQLPPVSRNGVKGEFVHMSEVWTKMDIKICYLHEQFRQEDMQFLQILTEIRNNTLSETTKSLLIKRLNKKLQTDIKPTKLFAHNADVDAINNTELTKIKEASQTYNMAAIGNKTLVDMLKKSCLAPEELVLKKGAVVMFVKNNFNKGYVNGTQGKIVGFDEENNPIVETINKKKIIATPESWKIEENDKVLAQIAQVPLRLAWAITVHKSQGMSLDTAVIDLSKAFEPGMGYVALSRVRTLNGIKLLGINSTALMVNDEVLQLDQKLQQLSKKEEEELAKIDNKTKQKRQAYFIKDMLSL